MNNQIKKVFTLVLTFCLILSISCVAFADSFTDGNPTTRSLAHCENGRVLVTRDTRYETQYEPHGNHIDECRYERVHEYHTCTVCGLIADIIISSKPLGRICLI